MKHAFSVTRVGQFARTAISAGLLTAGLAMGSGAQAAISFSFDYSGNDPGVGFLEAGQAGIDRQQALVTAGNLFSNLFGGYFSDMATITMAVTSTNDDQLSTLASAGSNFVSVPGTFGDGEVIRNKLITGVDMNGTDFDGYVDVNWGYAWELDPNVPAVGPGIGQTFDLYAALFHEFTHALGFGSEISGSPASDRFGDGEEGSGFAGSWSKWDQYLTDCSANALVDGNYEVNQGAFTDAQDFGGCFVGANAVAANGGAVQLFANPDQSHLDEYTFTTAMMKPFRDYGPQEARDYNAVELGILTDLGYTRVSNNSVPEPSSLALLLLGLAGVAYRRRRA